MKKLDRYVLKSFAGPFIAILLVVVFILMMQFLWLYIDELVGKGLGLRVILEFLMWGSCTILPISIPLATLLGSMMVVGNLTENNEIMAIKSTGVSLGRVLAPLIAAAMLISVGAFFVNDRLVPKAYNKIYTLRDDILKTKNEIKIPDGTFYDGIEGYVLHVGHQDKKTRMMYDVMVYDHTGTEGNVSLAMADSARLSMSKAKDYLIFDLYDGCNYQEKNTRNYRETTSELQSVRFSRQELVIPLKNYSFEKSDSTRFSDQTMAMNLQQLEVQQDSLVRLSQATHDRHYMMLRTGTCFLKRSQLDTATLSGATVLFHDDDFCRWDDRDMEVAAMYRAKQKAETMQSEVENYIRDSFECEFFLRRTDVVILKMFATALACFILFFIGAPLGALIRKGGLGSSAIVSVLFFVLYWVVDISGNKLAKDGAVSAVNGVFVSAYVLAPIGAYLTWKAINDSSVLNMDQIKTWLRKMRSLISRYFRPVRIVYMGTPEFAVAPLDNLVRHGHKVVGVVTVADKPSGRGLKVNQSAVKQYAVAHDIPVLQPLSLKDPEFLEALKAWNADMFVVVAFRMLPEAVWSMPRLGTFNLHAALLPQYRGAAPINWTLINGERITGVTTFMIDKDIDTGGIMLREECRIGPDETLGELHDRLMEIGSNAVLDTVEGIIQRNVEIRVQRSFIQGSEVLKPAPKLTRELCFIDWSDTTSNVHNLIRGLSPYPAAYTELVKEDGTGVQLKIFRSVRMDLHGTPGEVLSDGKSYLAIATCDGAIGITDLQMGGKKRMDVKAFLAGFRDPCLYRAVKGTSMAEITRVRSL